MRTFSAAVAAAAVVLAAAACSAPDRPTTTPERPPVDPTTASRTVALPGPGASQEELDEALRTAAWDNRVDDAAALIGRGADVNAKDETEQSAYLVATSEGYLELLDLTLRNGARVDDKDSWNGTGLIRAAERGHHDVVGHLLRAGIAKDHVNRIGYQAVHEAVWLGEDTEEYVDTLRVLVAGGVELDRPSGSEGLTPLEMAVHRGYGRLAAALEAMTATTPPRDPDRALLGAAASGDADAAAVALRAGADLEKRDDRGRTPLLLASAADRVEVARLLVALQADPDALDDQHDTPWLSRASPAASRCSRPCCRRGPTSRSSTASAASRSSRPASAGTSSTCAGSLRRGSTSTTSTGSAGPRCSRR